MHFSIPGCSIQYQLQSVNLLIHFRYWVVVILVLSKSSAAHPPFTDNAAQYRKARISVKTKRLPFTVVTSDCGGAKHS